jgi:DNA-binding NarL/FixJ family response regulator
MATKRPLRILIVDDHEVVRRGLASVVARRPDFQVIGEAGTVAEAVKLSQTLIPDVVVLDIRLPDGSGIEACREIRSKNPEIKVLMLTSYSDEEAVMGAIMAGAAGYLLKQIGSQELLQAIERVGAGQSLLDPAVTARLLERMRSGSVEDRKWAQLLPQERAILELVTQGKTNREIAPEVHLSEKTVKNYMSRILAKLEMSRRSQAAAYMAERRVRRGM